MNYILLAEKRTGSTFLQTALNIHPNIIALDELFIQTPRKTGKQRIEFFREVLLRKEKKRDEIVQKKVEYLELLKKGKKVKPIDPLNTKNYAIEYLNRVFNLTGVDSIGFRLMYSQIDWWDNSLSLLELLRQHNCRVIHLKRNFFDTIISMKIKNLKRKQIDSGKIEKITLNPKEISKRMKEFIKEYEKYDTYYDKLKIPILHINFEDIISKKDNIIKENIDDYGMFNVISKEKTYINPKANEILCEFLSVPNKPMYSHISKFIDNKWDYIENAEEIKNYFSIK